MLAARQSKTVSRCNYNNRAPVTDKTEMSYSFESARTSKVKQHFDFVCSSTMNGQPTADIVVDRLRWRVSIYRRDSQNLV